MIGLLKSIFAYIWRTWSFLEKQFLQNYKNNYVTLLEPKNLSINGVVSFAKNPILGLFLSIIFEMRFFPKNSALSIFYLLKGTPDSMRSFRKNPMNCYRRKRHYWPSDWSTDKGDFIGLFFAWRWGSSNNENLFWDIFDI